MMLAFIMYMTLRNAAHQKDMVEVGVQGGGGWITRLEGVWVSEQGPGDGDDVPKKRSETVPN